MLFKDFLEKIDSNLYLEVIADNKSINANKFEEYYDYEIYDVEYEDDLAIVILDNGEDIYD